MHAELDRFVLVGARFSKLSVDERASLPAPGQQYKVTVTRVEPAIAKETYVGRAVIEIRVGLTARHIRDSNPDKPMFPGKAKNVLEVEITAGFVGRQEQLDGNLEEFGTSPEGFYRFTYWMLRERLTSVFALTILRGTQLPWDVLDLVKVPLAAERAAASKRTPEGAPARKPISKRRIEAKVVPVRDRKG